MTHQGVVNLFKVMTYTYTNFHPADIENAIVIWENLLRGFEDADVAKALEAYILSDTKGFAPSIGQIVDIMSQNPQEMSELEAWGLVNRAIRNGNYGAEEEFAKLPDVIRAAIGDPAQIREWASMPVESVQSVAQSNFMRSYRAVQERERKAAKMPADIARLFHKDAPAGMLPEKPELKPIEGVPMPEEARKKLDELRGKYDISRGVKNEIFDTF